MQTDAWLTEASHPDCCPLCSQPLSGSNTCPSCGFTVHEPARNLASRPLSSSQRNPITPIPARASAHRNQNPPARPSRHSTSSQPVTFSEQQASGWQHDSPSYEAASSLSSLSLIISETPTAPPRTTRRLPRATGRLEHIDEIDTVPPASARPPIPQADLSQTPVPPGSLSLRFDDLEAPNLALMLSEARPPAALLSIDEIDTLPAPDTTPSKALVPVPFGSRKPAVDAASWTAGSQSTTSLAARFVAARSPRRRRRRRFSPLDRTRWWLLRPGRIEFLFWVLGSVLLFGITFLLLLATVLSTMSTGQPTSGNLPSSATTVSSASATPTVASDLHMTLSSQAALLPGAELHLQGQGFPPRSRVVFLLDGRWPLLDQRGQAASIQTDASGRFTVTLWLGQGSAWSAGPHRILAREADNTHQAIVPITIAIPSKANAPVSSSPAPPVHPTSAPRPPTPTPVITPTPVPTSGITPTPVPSVTPAPAPTSSPVLTTTPAPPLGTSTPGQGQTVGPSNLSNALNGDGGSLFTRLGHLNPLVWVIGICYLLSMLFLGMAGILRRRHRHY